MGWCGASDSFIENRINDLPKWIKGISSQAFDDFSDILTEFRDNCVVLGITGDIVRSIGLNKTHKTLENYIQLFMSVFQWFEFQYLASNSDYDTVQVDDLVAFLSRYGLTSDQYTELDEILSMKFNEAKKLRTLTFFSGVCKGASRKRVKAALVSIDYRLK